MSAYTEGVTLRAACTEDLPALKALNWAHADGAHWSETAWLALLSASEQDASERRALLLLALSAAGELFGWLAATLVAGVTELEFVFVAPAMRGRGLGNQFVGAWLAWAVEGGAAEAWLELRASNGAAYHLYSAIGFVVQGRRKGYYKHPAEDAVLMRLCPVPSGAP